jgi:hypothetical protein
MTPNWAIYTGYFDFGRFGFGASTTPVGTCGSAGLHAVADGSGSSINGGVLFLLCHA